VTFSSKGTRALTFKKLGGEISGMQLAGITEESVSENLTYVHSALNSHDVPKPQTLNPKPMWTGHATDCMVSRMHAIMSRAFSRDQVGLQ
jgi:hypothetical protein